MKILNKKGDDKNRSSFMNILNRGGGNKVHKIKKGMKYSDICDKMKPLDMIIFKGSDIVSDTIRYFEKVKLGNGEWSHVGIIINTDVMPSIKNGVKGRLYIWESTASGSLAIDSDGAVDIESDKGVFGVQIRDLEHVIETYDSHPKTKIGWCVLKNNPIDKRDDETIDEYNLRFNIITNILDEYHIQEYHRFYDLSIIDLLAGLFPFFRKIRDRKHAVLPYAKNWLFCSELVANVYVKVGVLDPSIDPQDVVPVDLIGYDKYGRRPFLEDPKIITKG